MTLLIYNRHTKNFGKKDRQNTKIDQNEKIKPAAKTNLIAQSK